MNKNDQETQVVDATNSEGGDGLCKNDNDARGASDIIVHQRLSDKSKRGGAGRNGSLS